jgi:hypothetical protein
LDFHFVQRVVDEADLRAEVRAWAEQLAMMPPADVQVAKQGIHRQYELMGLADIALVQNRLPSGPLEQGGAFWGQVDKERSGGVHAAVGSRDTAADSDISRI